MADTTQPAGALPATKSGRLATVGPRRLGIETHYYWRCVDCGADFAGARCNGHSIGLCPWCRPDSKPWTNGRGL